jgi:ABC-2 type transport system ATP-binding protein
MIDIENLSFGYRPKKLLYKDLSLSLPSGAIYGLLGKNGAGKSTLLKNMIGLLFPTAGKVLINGFVPAKRLPSFLETIYFIPEEVYVPAITVAQYLNLFAPFYPLFDKEQLYSHLADLDVETAPKLNTLSFGQQKKFIIAFALACKTKILLMDEPTNGLDIPSKKRFRKLIAAVMNEDRTIFISTHQIRDLENLIDQVIIVDNGDLLLNASLDAIAGKLCFKTVDEIPASTTVLYEEDVLMGKAIVIENMFQQHTKVNLEHLFNAVTENPTIAKALFNH